LKELIDFLQNPDITETKIFKRTKCETADEAMILRYLTAKYIRNTREVDVLEVFTELFSDEIADILSKISVLKQLINKRYLDITGNNQYFLSVVDDDSESMKIIPPEDEDDLPNYYVEYNDGRDGFRFLEMTQVDLSLSDEFLLFLDKFILEHDENIRKEKEKFQERPYNNHYEYLQDQFEIVNILIKIYESNLKHQEKDKVRTYKNQLKNYKIVMASRIKHTKIRLFLEEFFEKNSLSEKEKTIFLVLLAEEYDLVRSDKNYRSFDKLLALITYNEPENRNKNKSLLEEKSKLITENLIEIDNTFIFVSENGKLSKNEFFIPDEVLEIVEFGYDKKDFDEIKKSKKEKKRAKKSKSKLEKAVETQELFELKIPQTDLKDVVLPKTTRDILDTIILQLDEKVLSRLVEWNIKKEDNGVEAKIIFYGPPGTGKTMTAISLAKTLNRELLHLDCSKILSMYVGESEKNVRNIFDTYYEIVEESGEEPILFLDEADQFLTARFESPDQSVSQMYNQMQNIFLEQIENFNGILIASTNLLENIDKAFSRRFNYKVEFKMPNKEQRNEIWEKTIPKKAPLDKNLNLDQLSEYKLSGGQINLIVKNTAFKVATMKEPLFTTEKFISEIERESKSNFDKSKKMGFLQK
jgi:SpoVK/Ycf46/Vps4 family AAA+-type ATPase